MLPVFPITLCSSWHGSATSLRHVSTQSCMWTSQGSDIDDQITATFFFPYVLHIVPLPSMNMFTFRTVAVHIYHPIQVPFLSGSRQKWVRLMSKSQFPLQLVLFCIHWHGAPLFCSPLFSSPELQPTFLTHDRLRKYYSIDRCSSTLLVTFCFLGNGSSNSLFAISWILLPDNVLFLLPETGDVFISSSKEPFTHLLKIKICYFAFAFAALHFYIVLLTDSKYSNRLVRHNFPLQKLVDCLFPLTPPF